MVFAYIYILKNLNVYLFSRNYIWSRNYVNEASLEGGSSLEEVLHPRESPKK